MKWLSVVWLMVAVLVPAHVTAQPKQADQELARQHYQLGKQMYQRENFGGALEQFKLAHRHSGKTALLYNMASCHESMGQLKQALGLLKRYAATRPANADAVQARIKIVRQKLEVRDRPTRAPKPAPKVKPQPAARPTPAPAGRPLRTGGWVAVGVGGALLVGGAVLVAVAGGQVGDLEQQAAAASRDYAEAQADESTARALGISGVISLAVGGAAVAAGAALLLLDRRGPGAERRAWIAPALGPGQAGLSAGIRF